MTVYVVDIEAVDTRYTKQWKEHLPAQMIRAGIPTVVISGGEIPQMATPGAFLNFAGTNSYKSQQMLRIADMIAKGTIKDGDYFLYTDAWNPTVIQLKYMAELLGLKIKIGGMWHAGSYDPQDFLGRLIGDAAWVRNAERSMYDCYDHNFFATQFHVDLFLKSFNDVNQEKIRIVGWPMEYLKDIMAPYKGTPKKEKIIFPHRVAPEKQVEIFRDLAKELPQYEWFVAQDQTLTKHEYHQHMAESKLMFSASLQETLGIGAYEAALVGTVPVLPTRLSYVEMWAPMDGFYHSEWTESWESYQASKPFLKSFIMLLMDKLGPTQLADTAAEAASNATKFFDGSALYTVITGSTRI